MHWLISSIGLIEMILIRYCSVCSGLHGSMFNMELAKLDVHFALFVNCYKPDNASAIQC